MAYIIAHINVMVLRKRYKDFKCPFKTPLYPLPQIIGIAGMAYAIWNNSPSLQMVKKVYLNVGLIVGILAIYAFIWVKFKMKKGLFEAEPIDEASRIKCAENQKGSKSFDFEPCFNIVRPVLTPGHHY